jgi:hypothetical protein
MLCIIQCVTYIIINISQSCIAGNHSKRWQYASNLWKNGQVEYLSTDFGNELIATFGDADCAHCLHSHHSVSSYCILFNGVIVLYGCMKHLKTALHTVASKINALFKGTNKTYLLHDFPISLGLDLSSPTPIFEDNQGTIKLIKAIRLTDTVWHNAIKIACLKETLDEGAKERRWNRKDK